MQQLVQKKAAFVPPRLQITAMMDMFTIIVFFLLFSFSDNPDEIKLDNAISLPQSTAQLDYDDTIKLFLSKTELKLNEKTIAVLKGDKIVDFDSKNPKDSQLYKYLQQYKQAREIEIKHHDENGDDGKAVPDLHILFFCDRDLPFLTINNIVKTAAIAGFPNFQFLVLET